MFCWNCGKEIEEKAVVCTHCGVAVREERKEAVQQPVINVVNTNTNTNTNVINTGSSYVHKKKWTAFWLCLFLGMFGAHRFYVRKTGTGILWMCTGGLCYIGWIADLISILCGAFRDKAGQRLV